MTEYRIKPNDLSILLSALIELHNELGDKVTPKILAERMSTKGELKYQYHQTSYMLRLLGFETRYKYNGKDRSAYIMWDEELVKRLQKDLPQIAERTKAQVVNESPYRSRLNFLNHDYFRADVK